KNAILNAVSWYDESAQKVIAKRHKMSVTEIEELTAHLGCTANDLVDFGWYLQPDGSYVTYESESELRDAENVPLKDDIHRYFLTEVKPHVEEAWINLDSVKIGYEISFNKYFYRHKPLRSLEEVTQDILALEEKADGLIADILGIKVATRLEPAE
ncbi:MAG: SAM-dependent DNA methyltransferase, partial [Maritalea sp.]